VAAARPQPAPAAPPTLVTLEEALRPYPTVSKKNLRRYIREGKLSASKPGHHLLVDPAELAELFRPRARTVAAVPIEPAAAVPAAGLLSCPACGRLSSADHRARCGK
jgi:hypothetical protein